MCRWGTDEPVEVTIHASASHTGETRREVKPIDACIAPLVRALDAAGIVMLGSCCGHDKGPGEILLADGRVLTILSEETREALERWRKLPAKRRRRTTNAVGDLAIVKPFGWGIETHANPPAPLIAETLLDCLAPGGGGQEEIDRTMDATEEDERLSSGLATPDAGEAGEG